MTLEDIIDIFGILSGRHFNESDARATEYGFICHDYIFFLKTSFLKTGLAAWPEKKLALMARLGNLKEDGSLSHYRALIDTIQEDVSVGGMTLKTLIPTPDEAQQFIQQLVSMMSIDKNILNESSEPENNKAEILAQLPPIKTAFENQEWESVISFYQRLQIKLQPYSHEYFDDTEYLALIKTLDIYLQALANTAATRLDFNEVVEDFYFLFMEARDYPGTNPPLREDCLIIMLNRLTELFHDKISITNKTVESFKMLIELTVQHINSGASPSLKEHLLALQRKLVNTLYEATSENTKSIIDNLLLAHRLMVKLFEGTKTDEDKVFLYIIHQKLYVNLKKFAPTEPKDNFKKYFKKVIKSCNDLEGRSQQWADHLKFYLKQIFTCVRIITPQLTFKERIFYFEAQLKECQRIQQAFVTNTDKLNLIRCQEELAENHFLLAEQYIAGGCFKEATHYLYKARLVFKPLLFVSAKAKQFELLIIQNIVINLARAALKQVRKDCIHSAENCHYLNTAIKENNTIPIDNYLNNPLAKLVIIRHQTQFAQLLFDYATIIFNIPATTYMSLSFFKAAAGEINKMFGLDISLAFQQQHLFYNHSYLDISFGFCCRFHGSELMDKPKLSLLIEIYRELRTNNFIGPLNPFSNDLTPQINNAFSLNRDILMKQFAEFKKLAPNLTFTSQLTLSVTEYNQAKDCIYKITLNETSASLQALEEFILKLKQTNSTCPYLPALERILIPLENLILLRTTVPEPTHQLRITA